MATFVSSLRAHFRIGPLARKLLLGQGLRRQRLIFGLQVGVIALAACAGVLVLDVAYSFRQAITERLYGYMGGLWIRAYGEEQESRPLPLDIRDLPPLPGLKAEAAIHLPMLLEGPGQRYEGLNLVAVAPTWWQTPWKDLLSTPPTLWQGDSLIILSKTVAQKLGVRVGDRLTALWLADPPRVRRLRVVALYEAHIDELDRYVGFVPIELGRTLLDWGPTQAHTLHLFLTVPTSPDSLAEALSWQLPYNYEILPVETVFRDIFDWIGLIQQNVEVILAIVLGLSFFSAASAFLVLQMVQRLRYELCWALGAQRSQLWFLTAYQATFSLSLGVLIGEGLAALLLYSQQRWEWIQLDPESYLIPTIPIYWYGSAFVAVAGVGIGLALPLTLIAYPRRRLVRLLAHTE